MIHARQLHGVASSREQEYLAGWQRARAELDNFRKRLAQQQNEAARAMQRSLLEPLLPLLDNFQVMATHLPEELKGHPWAQGVGHVGRQLETLLAAYGVTPIKDIQVPFDPHIHEAVEHVDEPGSTTGQVVAVIAPGWRSQSDTLRPAKVKVAR